MSNLDFLPDLPYWRDERSGNLVKTIERYFAICVGSDLKPLTHSELNLIGRYVMTWLEHPWLNLEPQLELIKIDLKLIEDYSSLKRCIDAAAMLGIDPF